MTENIDPNDIEDCQKQVFDLEAEVRELAAQLEADRDSREAWMKSWKAVLLRAERAEAALEGSREEVHELRAALERARALAEKWRRTTWDKDYGDELAALLAAGGEARP